MKPKIIFLGTPEFAIPSLKSLIKHRLKPIAVITAADKPKGRKQIITPSPVKKVALKHKIPIFQPARISDIRSEISKLSPDLIVVVAYGQIIPKEILDIPKQGSLNVHPSLLPKYRGPSPIQFAILNGEKETGVTIILMNKKMDGGPILSQERVRVTSRQTAKTLHNKLAKLGADLLLKTISQWTKKKITPQPQDESKATYTKILTRKDGMIFWNKEALEIERQIRAFDPWPGAYTTLHPGRKKPQRLKILKAKAVETEGSEKKYGKVFLHQKKKLVVQTGKGSLILERVQLEGKKPMKAEEFLRGYPSIVGAVLH